MHGFTLERESCSCHVAASERTPGLSLIACMTSWPQLTTSWSTVCISHHFHNQLITEVVMVMNNWQYALCKLVADIDNLGLILLAAKCYAYNEFECMHTDLQFAIGVQ